MESTATLRYARMSPRKVRRIVNVIKGQTAEKALTILQFMPHRASRILSKLVKSAMANAEQKDVGAPEEMVLVNAYVNQGPTMKRIMPRAMGRANQIKKRTSHITLILSDLEE